MIDIAIGGITFTFWAGVELAKILGEAVAWTFRGHKVAKLYNEQNAIAAKELVEKLKANDENAKLAKNAIANLPDGAEKTKLSKLVNKTTMQINNEVRTALEEKMDEINTQIHKIDTIITTPRSNPNELPENKPKLIEEKPELREYKNAVIHDIIEPVASINPTITENIKTHIDGIDPEDDDDDIEVENDPVATDINETLLDISIDLLAPTGIDVLKPAPIQHENEEEHNITLNSSDELVPPGESASGKSVDSRLSDVSDLTVNTRNDADLKFTAMNTGLNGNAVRDGSIATSEDISSRTEKDTEKDTKMFNEFLNALITTKKDNDKVNFESKQPTTAERHEVIAKTEKAIESLRAIINKKGKDGYISMDVFMKCINDYDSMSGTTVKRFLTSTNETQLKNIFNHPELKRRQDGGGRVFKDTSPEINYKMFLDKLSQVNTSNSKQIPSDDISLSEETNNSDFNTELSNGDDAAAKKFDEHKKYIELRKGKYTSPDDYIPVTSHYYARNAKRIQSQNTNQSNDSYIPPNKTSSSLFSFFSSQPESISNNNILNTLANPPNGTGTSVEVKPDSIAMPPVLSQPILNTTDTAANAAVIAKDVAKKAYEKTSKAIAETSSGVSDAFSSISNATTKATTSLYSSILTPAEQLVRDKLITEVSNIARNPGSPDTVNTLTGVINRDMTHGDLVIDSKTVMSDVSKKLDGIPDMASKIAYIHKLTEMVNKYSDILDKAFTL
jgi:hypothetical protein